MRSGRAAFMSLLLLDARLFRYCTSFSLTSIAIAIASAASISGVMHGWGLYLLLLFARNSSQLVSSYKFSLSLCFRSFNSSLVSSHCYLIFYCHRSDLSWPDWHCWWLLWFSASYRLFLLVQVAAIFFPSNLCSCGLIRGSLLLPLPFREAEFYHGFDPSPRRILQRNWYVPRTRVRREWETYYWN